MRRGLRYFRPVIIVADSGSTKTDWRILAPGKPDTSYSSTGLNPFFVSSAEVSFVVNETFAGLPGTDVQEVFFYGAGCSSPDRNRLIAEGIQSAFPQAKVNVQHDLLAAARALFKATPGIACILGTGSNTCFFDGEHIRRNVPALGYVLGDDGSGAHLGRELVRAYLYGELSPPCMAFMEARGLHKEAIFQRVYQEPQANRFLASLAPICHNFREDDSMRAVIKTVFGLFTTRLLTKYLDYSQHPVGMVGSIAVAFETEIRATVEGVGFHLEVIRKKPIDDLADFHRVKG